MDADLWQGWLSQSTVETVIILSYFESVGFDSPESIKLRKFGKNISVLRKSGEKFILWSLISSYSQWQKMVLGQLNFNSNDFKLIKIE